MTRKEMRSQERRQKSKGNEEAVGVKQGMVFALRWCHHGGRRMVELLQWVPERGKSSLISQRRARAP